MWSAPSSIPRYGRQSGTWLVSERLNGSVATASRACWCSVALTTLIAYRLWRRRRYGAATADVVIAGASCVEGPASLR